MQPPGPGKMPPPPNEPYLYDLQDEVYAREFEDIPPGIPERTHRPSSEPEGPHERAVVALFKRPPIKDEYFYAGAEYLRWWAKDGPVAAPLVTTGSSAVDPLPGAIGQSTTVPLFGGDDFDFDDLSGARVTIGWWKDHDRRFGFEITGFVLEERSLGFDSRSDAAGNPPVFLPFFSAQAGNEAAFVISDPGLNFLGNLKVVADTQFWGIETNTMYNVWRQEHNAFDIIGGFRYADLGEKIVISADLFDPVFNANSAFLDRFDTRSQFYGGQIGFHTGWRFSRLTVDFTGKVALGMTRSRVSIDGLSTQSGGLGPQGTFASGVLTQASNIGARHESDFAVLPQAQIKVGYDILRHITLFAGYDFVYWNQVVRAGDQIDRSVNTSQAFGGTLVGPASPQRVFVTSDYWAHGLSGGLFIKF